ncbi:type I DNA topoisomerase [Salinispira pacifica]|uniref:DNA topoisomerase 1 n=1 Tax=Salinispira pacifica TaxID=1307761 RepID=V5WEN6_9SPIO|nr:type I DNA topoisomerase [Salinispira pacifica]AHC14277.1 DNA topoisomerase I [Salinispira pacifica]
MEEEKYLVIVESPTKARTISRFLPKNFIVEASIGHVRDLPQTASDVPKKYKGLDWARLGIDVEHEFAPLYITPKGKGKIINELKRKMKEADAVYLATDEDREGESISWHLVQVLKPEKKKVAVKRMVFHEITKKAISAALEDTRDIDMNLVKAQETRRILDRLYGFTLSPLIWKKIAYGLSAGRVQSPGLRMIVERERERIAFRKAVYWDIKARLSAPDTKSPDQFDAKLISYKDTRLASGKDFNSITGELLEGRNVLVMDETSARKLEGDIKTAEWKIIDVSEKETTSRPSVPFITSTLQQEGNRKLNLTARETMRTAQKLYEEGLITYMRTDSPTLSSEAISGARDTVESLYGKEYLSDKPRQYSSKDESAQEAHEAIRPAGSQFTHPDETGLSGKEKALYEIIWKRTLATQMADAKKSSTTVKIQAGDAVFQANGTKILFPGFLKLYVEGKDDPDAKKEDREVILPDVKEGMGCELHETESLYHETKPPARYTEASLIQNLEKQGIGRPSTYSSIISTLFDRGYIRKIANALAPTFTGMGVIQFLENNFHYLIEYGFSSEMESTLDSIASGNMDRLQYLKDFYSGKNGIRTRVDQREDDIKPEESRVINLPQADKDVEIRIGRFGPYIIAKDSDGNKINASIPEEIAPADLTKEDIDEIIELQIKGPEPLGEDPDSGEPVYCLIGRYGPYVQLGQVTEEVPKPKRAGIPKGRSPRDVTLEEALKYLSLPRTLGEHPESGKEVVANVGRFGPFVVHDGDFRSLKKDDDVYSIELPRALEILAEEKSRGRQRSKLIRELGEFDKKKVALYDGKYGPYIKYGSKNISLPDEKKTDEALKELTIEEAGKIIKKK